MTASTNFSAGTVVTSNWLNAIDASNFDDVANVRRYGAVGDGVTDDTTAFVDALAAKRHVFIPAGTYKITSTLSFENAGQCLFGVGDTSVISYTGTGTALDFNGKYYCEASRFKLMTNTGAIGIDLPFVSHFWQIDKLQITGFSTAGVRGTSCFYGTLQRCDINQCEVGLLGVQEFNGNFINNNSFRGNIRAIWLRDVALNSDGNQIINNELEDSGRAGVQAFIDIEGAEGTIIVANRFECSVTGMIANIYIHGGTGVAGNNQIVNNFIAGTSVNVPSIVVGTSSGTGVKNTTVSDNICLAGDSSNQAILIYNNATYSVVRAHRRHLGDGAYTILNSSSTTILTFSDDTAFTVDITGLTTTPTALWKYQVSDNVVTLFAQTLNGTSNTTACTITGIPALLRPINSQTVLITIQDNGVIQMGKGVIDSSGVMTLSSSVGGAAFTNSGSKGFIGCVITYPLN